MAADQNARERLVRFLDEEAFDPILRTSPDRYSGNDRDKLEHVKAPRRGRSSGIITTTRVRKKCATDSETT